MEAPEHVIDQVRRLLRLTETAVTDAIAEGRRAIAEHLLKELHKTERACPGGGVMERVEILGVTLRYSPTRSGADVLRWSGEHPSGLRVELSYHDDTSWSAGLCWCIAVRDARDVAHVAAWGHTVDEAHVSLARRASEKLASIALVAGLARAQEAA